MIDLGREASTDFQTASSREWLETNGIGGYASSTLCGANTRRYHGLLTASTRPPLGRVVVVSKFEETVIIDGQEFHLSSNQYPGSVYPEGYKYIARFRLDPFPVWTFGIGNVRIEKKLFMVHGENTTVVMWSVAEPGAKRVSLEIKPLFAFRDHHHLRHEDGNFDLDVTLSDGDMQFYAGDEMPTLHLTHNAETIVETRDWYRNFEYAIERERGFDFHEDLLQAATMRFDLSETAAVILSTEKRNIECVSDLEAGEGKRRSGLLELANAKDPFTAQLVLAADQFIVDRGSGKSVIAGYPWFSDWGRDTMIALPGLTLATGRPDVAKSILAEFAKHISEGMLPNRFPDEGETPDYNTVDATLWYFEAIRAYVAAMGDIEFVRDTLYEKLTGIIDWHVRGTRYNIHVDTDGLLFAGTSDTQLTWMDAKVDGWVVTPRTGKAVEIQALWYNALRTMEDFAAQLGDAGKAKQYSDMAAVAKESFKGQFWNEEGQCLFDVVNGSEKDGSIRPNQIFAVSLHYSMLDTQRARLVFDSVERDLLTPVGLRSLAPDDERYVGVYTGSPRDRDAAYHQGTVWAWLIGPFVDAYRRVEDDPAKVRTRLDEIVDGFHRHMNEATVGQISEIFDGDPPHHPRGCGAQAWSVSEVLRIMSYLDPSLSIRS